MQVKSSSPKGLLLNQGISKPEPDPEFYREVELSDLPSGYTEDINLRQFFLISLSPGTVCLGPLPVWTLNDVAGQQELRPRGPSAILHSVLN